MTTTPYANLIRHIRETATLDSCAAVLGWDERTHMPPKAAGHRADQMAALAKLAHRARTDPRVGELLTAAQPVDDGQAANLREIRRQYERAVKLPPDLVEELARVTSQAQSAWQHAKEQSDFAAFRPWLEKIVALKRREVDAVGYTDSVYDALLDEYEPGATAASVGRVFDGLKRDLIPLVAAIVDAGRQPRRDILRRDYAVDRQAALARAVATAIGYDFDAGRLDVSSHPFCTTLGPGDVRITTRYHPNQFGQAFFGTLHEVGHALYEQGLPADDYGTPLGTACSLGVHESQSRLWENAVGRGRPFWEHFLPRVRAAFPGTLDDVSLDDMLFAVKDVKASFIRVDADEVTYNLHIVFRFELEVALLTGDLAVGDLPGAWAEKFQAAFQLTPPDDAHGCLQDIHWSFGGFGYFPTYTLGNLYAAQFMTAARRELPDLDDDFRRGEFGRLKLWLNEKIHRHGQRYRADALCELVTGEPLNPRHCLDYLKSKYAPLYGIKT